MSRPAACRRELAETDRGSVERGTESVGRGRERAGSSPAIEGSGGHDAQGDRGGAFKKKPVGPNAPAASTKSERSTTDSLAPMGYAATRTLDRVSTALGLMGAASIEFASAQDIPQGGLLLAVPALLAVGLLLHSFEMYALPRGYYGLSSILLLLAMMALGRLKSIEQLRYAAPGEWGNLLGLDRIPEVRTLPVKLQP